MKKNVRIVEKNAQKEPGKFAKRKKLAHKLYLLHQMLLYGFDDAIKYRSEEDIAFLISIKNIDFSTAKKDLERQLSSLSV